jgi:hypothetical protein
MLELAKIGNINCKSDLQVNPFYTTAGVGVSSDEEALKAVFPLASVLETAIANLLAWPPCERQYK